MGSRLQCNMDYKYYSGFRKRKRHGNLLHGGKHRRETNRNYCHWRKNLYSDASGSLYLFSHAILRGGSRRCDKRNGGSYNRSNLSMDSCLPCGMDYKYYSGFRQRKRNRNLFPAKNKNECKKNRDYCYWRANFYGEAAHCALYLCAFANFCRSARWRANRNGECYNGSLL